MLVTSRGYQTDLAILAMTGSFVEDRGDHLVVRSPDNPHYWWGNFILASEPPTPERSQLWLERFAVEFPDAEHVALGFDGCSPSAEDAAWYSDRGYHVEVSSVMTTSDLLPPRRLHEAAVCRELSSDDDWAQSVELRVRCNDRPIDDGEYREYCESRASSIRHMLESGPGAWFGAFVDGVLAAQMGLVAVGSGLARFQSVETDPGHRRWGLAGMLLHYAGRYGFDRLEARRLVIVADPDYFAIDLYRSVGFETAESQLQVELPPVRG